MTDAPLLSGDYDRDRTEFSAYWVAQRVALDALPPKAVREPAQQQQATRLLDATRTARRTFLQRHVATLYRKLTDEHRQLIRLEDMAFAAAEAVPGLCPTRAQVAQELALAQKHKDGHEIDQGLLFNHILADPQCGIHLCHAMLLPKPQSQALRAAYARDGRVDLGTARIERRGAVSVVSMCNPRYLNAEDDTTIDAVEAAIDLALLDAATTVGVLRGGPIDKGKYAGQSVFSTGINLTHLYNGQVSYLWYLEREMGFINKMYRGLALPNQLADEIHGETQEKPWIAAVEKFAIGGGCQYLLVMDYIIAERGAYLTLPARKEGIIPGAANMRLPRFVGDRIARQAIMAERRIDCDSPEGRMICDEIVAPGALDAAVMERAALLANSGVVSAASNRKSFRIAHETLDQFRCYMAVYAREQAYCHFSAALISNLERFWDAQNRRM